VCMCVCMCVCVCVCVKAESRLVLKMIKSLQYLGGFVTARSLCVVVSYALHAAYLVITIRRIW
jgi:hypothetical protein